MDYTKKPEYWMMDTENNKLKKQLADLHEVLDGMVSEMDEMRDEADYTDWLLHSRSSSARRIAGTLQLVADNFESHDDIATHAQTLHLMAKMIMRTCVDEDDAE